MPRMIYDYTKNELESASYSPVLFKKSLKKASRNLLPYEMDQLKNWLSFFTTNKPELKNCSQEVIHNNKN